MHSYVIRRLLLIIPTLLLVTITVFCTIRLIPGSVVDLMASQQEMVSLMNVKQLRAELGLDVPILTQYGRWIGVVPQPKKGFSGILQGDLGTSLWTHEPVTQEIRRRLSVSFELGSLAMLISLLIALPVGIYSAIRQDTVGDYLGRSLAIICISTPSFWLGTLVVTLPAIWWHWSPRTEYVPFIENPLGNIVMFIIPATIMGMLTSGVTMRMTRTTMLEVLRQDYIRTAWSKGLSERVIIFRHALKNALLPVVTIIGTEIPFLVSGSVVLESIFVLPGLGRLLLEVLQKRDYPLLSGINLIVASVVLLTNLVVDLTYAYLDPRVTYK